MAAKSSENTYFELKLPNREEESVLPSFEQKLESYNALLIGPGLGEFSWKPAYMFNLAEAKKLKTVIDADALNYLARTPEWWKQMPPANILTPHPAELARLRGTDVATIEVDRVKAAREAAAEFQQVVVLKGAYTIIAAPDGRLGINPAANPALATAGSGDVLAGICAGLLAQASKYPDFDSFKVACCGVYLHALAGDLCRREMGDTGVLAGDLLSKIPLALRNLKQGDSLE
jgi:NAD(P)H-hydrate epimerase